MAPCVWPLGKEAPVAVSFLKVMIPSSPMGRGKLKMSFKKLFKTKVVKTEKAINSPFFLSISQ